MTRRELGKIYVLVHGAWHGGWCWRDVKEALRRMGHRVGTPTQTGLGERKHLLPKEITLDIFTADILIGHGFARTSITGVADKIPITL